MILYLDDNSCKVLLAVLLRKAGHTVVLPSDVGCAGATDARHFLYAIQSNLTLLTKDYEDFLELHDVVRAAQGHHPGNDRSRDMRDRDIVRAIDNLEQSRVAISDEFHVLNHWR